MILQVISESAYGTRCGIKHMHIPSFRHVNQSKTDFILLFEIFLKDFPLIIYIYTDMGRQVFYE
jgi:hypothetical protein